MSAPHRVPPDHTLPHFAPRPTLAPPPAAPGWRRILVASDGTSATDAAVSAAHILARRSPCAVDVAAIYAPRIPFPILTNRRGLDGCEPRDRVAAAQMAKAVRTRCRALVPLRAERAGWGFHLEVGDPGATLVRLASQLSAELVVVGLGQSDPFDTIAGGRTAVCAARYLQTSMLAAVQHEQPMSRALVVFPNGRLHAATLRAALITVARPAKLWLAFPDGSSWATGVDSQALDAAVRLLCEAEASTFLDDVKLELIVVRGDLLSGALSLADDLSAELIAVPNYGDPGPVRSFLPNLAEPLLVGARTSVLVVPDTDAASG